MPAIKSHHIFDHLAHQGGVRSGMRKPHRFHASVKTMPAKKPEHKIDAPKGKVATNIVVAKTDGGEAMIANGYKN